MGHHAIAVDSLPSTVDRPFERRAIDTDEGFVAEPDNPHRAHDAEGADRPVLATGAPPVDDVHSHEPEP